MSIALDAVAESVQLVLRTTGLEEVFHVEP